MYKKLKPVHHYQLRYNYKFGCWEVYSFISPHITKWKWFQISLEDKEFYEKNFQTTIIESIFQDSTE